jgi:hypothetical protein
LKKSSLTLIVLCFLTLSLSLGQQEKVGEKPDPMKNFSIVSETQPPPEKVKVGFDSITAEDAVTYLEFISSDLLEGRDTGAPGHEIAAHYAASMFKLWGIKPAGDVSRPAMDFRRMMRGEQPPSQAKRSYFQNIVMVETLGNEGMAAVEWQKGQLKKSQTFQPGRDYSYYASETQTLTAPVVFVGYGIQEPSLKFDEYKNLDVKGKFVMMLSEAPGKDNPESPFNKGDLKEKYYPQRRRMRRASSPKFDLARDLGASAILLVENSPESSPDIARRTLDARQINDERPIFPGPRRRVSLYEDVRPSRDERSIPTIQISPVMADAILDMAGTDIKTLKGKIEETLQSQSMVLEGVTFTLENKAETQLVNSMNVLGYIEGTDPELKNQAVVIGGHLDHLGRRGDYIFNGVMEIAEAFAKNPVKPKRSILFALWTGEEKGLLGSYYYVAHPFFAETAADLNLDMISRVYDKERLAMISRRWGQEIGKEALEKIDVKKYVSLSYDAHTPEIEEIIRRNNGYVGLHMHIDASEEASGGSDHAPFGQAKIPWAFFIAAMTEDYHQPSDTVDKVTPELMEKIIRITYLTAFELADR